MDINDTRYSGYKKISKSPTIFFGNDKWEKLGSTKISDDVIEKNALKYGLGNLAKNAGKTLAKQAGILSVSISTAQQIQVQKYLREHPNSKLSRKEILDMLNK